ncbi:MAG TPA: hypothetical protein VN039_13365 [Nitrospira sp.]|nr:hypothetical protein [Nitrospira sp.]
MSVLMLKPMLASKVERDKLTFPAYMSPKLDGVRCLITGPGIAMSRSMKAIPNEYVQSVLGREMIVGLDGELCVGPYNAQNLMQATTSGVMSEDGEPDFTFYVFDYFNSIANEPYDVRINKLVRAFETLDKWAGDVVARHVKLLPQALVNSIEEMDRFEQICLEHGFEGAMYRKVNGAYKFGRSTAREGHLLKLKQFLDGEAVVIGAEELCKNENELTTDELGYAKRSSHKDGKVPIDSLGAFICRDLKSGIEFNIGTGLGLTLELRKRFWEMHKRGELVGKIVTYKSQHVGVKEKPRIPVWHAMRDPKDMS